MISSWILILIILFVFIFFLLIVFLYRRVFVFPEIFGTYTAPLVSPCSAPACGEEGTQIFYQKCIPNSTTGLGCLNGFFEQTFTDRIIERRNCQASCPKTQEVLINKSPCIDGQQTATYLCKETGFSGPELCIAGTLSTVQTDCFL